MITRLLQAGIMAAWAVFFLWLVAFGQNELARLLHPRLWWLVLCGALILVLFFVVVASRLTEPHSAGPLRWQWPSFVILLVPLLYFVPMKTARFDSQTFLSRSTSIEAPFEPPVGEQDSEIVPDDAALPSQEEAEEDDASFGRIALNPQQYDGKTVEVACQTLNDQRLPDNLFICYRFRITCCAADAQPVFLLVEKGAAAAAPANDSWVKVKGPLSIRQMEGMRFGLIKEATVTPGKEPIFPFVF